MTHTGHDARAIKTSVDRSGVTRRRFLTTSAVVAASSFAAPTILRARGVSEKLNIAIIGSGGRGGAHLDAVAGTENIVTLCDVNASNLGRAAAAHPQARKVVDFRVRRE